MRRNSLIVQNESKTPILPLSLRDSFLVYFPKSDKKLIEHHVVLVF